MLSFRAHPLCNVFVGCILFFTLSCQNDHPMEQTELTISDVISDAVTTIYSEGREAEFANYTQEDVLQEFNDEEKMVLASKYWVFDINQKSEVYVCRSVDQDELPFWIPETGFQKTDMQVKNKFNTYEVWKKTYPAGRVELGINGFDRHNRVYFTIIRPLENQQPLVVEPVYPTHQIITPFHKGSYTYFDWDELVITELPDELTGATLLVTNRGRSREAHLMQDAFRTTDFPSSDTIDQILLTWSSDPKTTMDIGWRTSTDEKESTLRYWTPGSTDTAVINGQLTVLEDRMLANDRFNHRFRSQLTDLKPGITYQYQLSTPTHTSRTYEFMTDDGGDAFEFGWFGDVHSDPDWGKLVQKGDSLFPNIRFYIQSGDNVNTGLFRDDWDKTIGYSGDVFRSKPYMATPGNHDAQEGLPPTRYLEYLKYPHNGPAGKQPGLTYTFTYGNTQFFMMDCVSIPVEEQADWLEQELKDSDATFKIAAFHFSPFTPHEDYSDIKESWVPLFEKYGLDLVLTGHFHYYQRTKAYGADLNETGTPTYIMSVGTTYKNKERTTPQAHEVVYFRNHMFPHITVDGNRLEIVTYDRHFEELDRYVIEK